MTLRIEVPDESVRIDKLGSITEVTIRDLSEESLKAAVLRAGAANLLMPSEQALEDEVINNAVGNVASGIVTRVDHEILVSGFLDRDDLFEALRTLLQHVVEEEILDPGQKSRLIETLEESI